MTALSKSTFEWAAVRCLLPCALVLALCGAAAARARQAATPPSEEAAVRKVVETYLYAEEAGEKGASLHGEAHIVFIDDKSRLTRAVRVSRRKARPGGARGKIARSPQKVVAVDVVGDAASVKVSTEWPAEGAGELRPKHFQYLWLLKAGGEWKIVGILMPSVELRGQP